MSETDKVINDLNVVKLILWDPKMLTTEMCIRIGQAVTSAIALLKEQETQINELERNLVTAKENMSYLIRTGMLKKEVKQND